MSVLYDDALDSRRPTPIECPESHCPFFMLFNAVKGCSSCFHRREGLQGFRKRVTRLSALEKIWWLLSVPVTAFAWWAMSTGY